MAKQEEQKQETDAIARQLKSGTSIPARFSAVSPTTRKLSVETDENETETREKTENAEETGAPFSAGTGWVNRRQLLIGSLGAAATALGIGAWIWEETTHQRKQETKTSIQEQGQGDQLVILWNNTALQAIQNTHSSMPVAARALAIVHTCMYDAWAAYDSTALSTRSGARLRQPADAQTVANKSEAVSFAAYRALMDLFPTEQAYFSLMMQTLNYNQADRSTNSGTPASIGNLAAQAVLDLRHRDDANQLGDLNPGPYSDYTGYRPINTPQDLKDPNHWQPQLVANAKGLTGSLAQHFEGAQWANVTPFALTSTTNLLPGHGPARYPNPGYTDQARQILRYSAGLTNMQKGSIEYWLNDPIVRWCQFAQFIAQRDKTTLDQNVKLFFALTNAALDTSIACWAVKRAYDSPYPMTVIRYLFNGQQVQAWGGPGKGSQMINGTNWRPYRPASMLTPAFPEYCAENSAFSSAAAEILRNFTNSDRLGMSYTQLADSSNVEPDSPVSNLTLGWNTLSQAVNDAGLSGCYSGTHFPQSDQDGRLLGQKVGITVWLRVQNYITGRH